MLMSKLGCSVVAVFTFVFFIAKLPSAVPQGLTLSSIEANSCEGCTKDSGGSRTGYDWCVSSTTGYQGCRATGNCNDPAVNGLAVYPCTGAADRLLANCKGCVGGGNSWCVVYPPEVNGAPLESKCVLKVNDVTKGHPDCRNGEIYNKCERVSGTDVVPRNPGDLAPFPLYKTCQDCIAANKHWCTVDPAIDFKETRYCRETSVTNPVCRTVVASGGSCSSTAELNKFYYTYTPQTCKACVLVDSDLWCNKGLVVDFKGCISKTEALTKCRGGNLIGGDCGSKSAETVHEANLFSKNCDFCQAFGGKWCESTGVSDEVEVTGRSCFAGSCPTDFRLVDRCPEPNNAEFYTHFPAVSQNLPRKCGDCQEGQTTATGPVNAWCAAADVKLCLPRWSFDFYCPTRSTERCEDANDLRKALDNPLYLAQNCDKCVEDGKWCVTEINGLKFQFCAPKDKASTFCIGPKATIVTVCDGLSGEQRRALIPTPVPKNCKQCIAKGGWKWCVHSGYGDKIAICLPDEFAEVLCTSSTRGVAFNHCEIAEEDKELILGLLKLLDGSPAFASLSLMAVAVALGFSLF